MLQIGCKCHELKAERRISSKFPEGREKKYSALVAKLILTDIKLAGLPRIRLGILENTRILETADNKFVDSAVINDEDHSVLPTIPDMA